MQLQRFSLLLALPLVISLSACIVIPVEPGDEEPFKDEQLTFIEIGTSTKEDFATAMSEFAIGEDKGEAISELTPIKFKDGDWWLYAQIRKETKWAYAVVGAYGGEGGAAAGTIGDVDFRFLLIKFDNSGLVGDYQISSSEGTGCNRQGVCVRGSKYMLLAPSDEDRVAKQFDIPTDGCAVYLYGKSKAAVSIWLDAHRVGWHLDKKQFFSWQLDQGMHQLASHTPDRQIEFSCVAGGLYFFELKRQGTYWNPSYWTDIEHRDAVKGRKAIGKRRLTLSITEPSD